MSTQTALQAFALVDTTDTFERDPNTSRNAESGLPIVNVDGKRGVIVNDASWHADNAEEFNRYFAIASGIITSGYFQPHIGHIEGLALTLLAVCASGEPFTIAGDEHMDYGEPAYAVVPMTADAEGNVQPITADASCAGDIVDSWDRGGHLTSIITAYFRGDDFNGDDEE